MTVATTPATSPVRRACSSCTYQRLEAAGRWLNCANGRVRRWQCAGCAERAAQRRPSNLYSTKAA